VAISTSGRSPFMAAELRRDLERHVGPEYGDLVELVGNLRDRLRAAKVPLPEQNRVYSRIAESGALELLRAGKREEAAAAINACAGALPG
jgi:precorrin-2 dehydrogenase/sirohydrochlorin ferrochelatase